MEDFCLPRITPSYGLYSYQDHVAPFFFLIINFEPILILVFSIICNLLLKDCNGFYYQQRKRVSFN